MHNKKQIMPPWFGLFCGVAVCLSVPSPNALAKLIQPSDFGTIRLFGDDIFTVEWCCAVNGPGGDVEDRSVVHFDVSALSDSESRVTLHLPIENWDPEPPPGSFAVLAFEGDGIVSADEWQEGTLWHEFTGLVADEQILSVDITGLFPTQATYVSFNLRDVSSSDRYFLGVNVGQPDPTLSVSPICDFHGDGSCNIDDIDSLVAEIVAGTNDPLFDLTGDGVVTLEDATDSDDGWLRLGGEENLGPGLSYIEADITLDGVVDGLDFIEWNENKFTSTGLWSFGDLNADGVTDGQDFIIWNDFKFTSSDDVNVVPEPRTMLLSFVALVLLRVARPGR